MNILYLCDEYPPGPHGGIGTAVQTLARALVRLGHRVIVAGFYQAGYGGKDLEEDEGVAVHRYRLWYDSTLFQQRSSLLAKAFGKLLRVSGIEQYAIRAGLRSYHRHLCKLIRQHEIDLVEQPDFNEYVARLRQPFFPEKLPAPTVVRLHGCYTYLAWLTNRTVSNSVQEMEAHILQQADAVCSVSRFTAQLTTMLLHYHGPVHVIPNGIQLPGISAVKAPMHAVFSGTLMELKGIRELMAAWNKVHKKLPAAKLFVYGKGPVAKLQTMLDADALSSVVFMGHVPRAQLLRALAAAPVAVFPSFAETFGLAALEAMASRAAVIFTKRASGPELIEDGISGILIDPADTDAIADQLMVLLQDEAMRSKLAENGYRRVLQHFSIEKVAEAHIRFYESVPGAHTTM